MQTTLNREHFINRAFEPDDFASMVAMLSDWFLQKRQRAASLCVSVEFWGFPRFEKDSYLARATAQAAALGLASAAPTLTDSDTMSLSGPIFSLTPGSTPSTSDYPTGTLMRFATAPEFQNLCVEMRVGFTGPGTDYTVVFYGIVRQERFWLLSLWAVGNGEFKEEIFAHTPWPHEARLIDALHDYKNGVRPMPAWARNPLFQDETGQITGNALVWFLRPDDNHRLRGFLERVGLCLGVILVASYLLYRGVYFGTQRLSGLYSILGLPLLLALAGLAFHLLDRAKMIRATHTNMSSNYRRMYAQSISFRDVDITQDPEAFWDPAIHKLTKELTELGGQHLRDIAHDPPLPNSTSTIRLFAFPESNTIFTLMLLHKTGKYTLFPAKPVFHLRTNLSDGFRLISANGGAGYRKPLPGSLVLFRLFTSESNPAEMLRKHNEAVRKITSGTRQPLPLEPERILFYLVEEHEEARVAGAKYGYFGWADAFRMVFHITLPEYRD